MTENADLTAFKKNPELFKIKLRDAVEQITADTSGNANTLHVHSHEDVLIEQKEILQKEFYRTVDHLLNNMWSLMEITPKISFLNELEATYPKDFVAWRPTTGEVPIMSLKGEYLTETKARLLYKIDKFKKEREELKEKHSVKLNALKESLEKINKGEEYLFNIYNEYEKIIT